MTRINTRYNWKDLVSVGLAFSGVEITDAGTDAFYFTDLHAILEEGFSLNTQADGLGTDITGFTLSEKNDQLTRVYNKDVYEKIAITDVAYQTGTIYATGYYSGDVNFAEYFNSLQSQIDNLLTGTSTMLLSQLTSFPVYQDLSAYGLLAFTHDSFSQANYQGLFDTIGHIFNAMHVSAGGADLSASGTLFYATPIPGYYERGGTQDTAIIDSTSDVDDSTELITLATADYDALHMTRGVLGTGADGVPVRVKLVSGALPTGLAVGTTYYVRFKTTPDIELYTTEADAINTAATTGRVDLTDAVGTFKITQEGVYFDDVFQKFKFSSTLNIVDTPSSGYDLATGPGGTVEGAAKLETIINGLTSYDSNGTPRTSNESRPKTFISFGYIKAEHITIAGEPISALRYESDWTLIPSTGSSSLITHNLVEDFENLIKTVSIKDGSGNESEVVWWYSTNHYGGVLRPNDNNSLYFQVGAGGIQGITSSGTAFTPTHYKVVVTKPNLVATYADTSFRKVYDISDATDETFTLPDASTILTEYIIKRRGSGAGKVTITPSGTDKIELEDQELSTLVMVGTSTLVLFPSGGNWEVKSYKGTVLIDWSSTSTWTAGASITINHNFGVPFDEYTGQIFVRDDSAPDKIYNVNNLEIYGQTSGAQVGQRLNGIDGDLSNCYLQIRSTNGSYIADSGSQADIPTTGWSYKVVLKFNF